MRKENIIKNESKLILAIALFFILSLTFVSAEANVCCEKTINGAWCQNSPSNQCDTSFKTSPTSCDSTSYCKKGCCYDSKEGLCMESTSQRVCSDSNGTWDSNKECNIPQCSLGCCILADQGAFVTLARCKALSGFYGIATDFRKNILNEVTCIATAQGDDKGACVYEDPQTFQKTCKFTSRSKCKTSSLSLDNSSLSLNTSTSKASTGFYKDILCTAEELGVICAATTKTTLIDGKDEVYFLDTCGNIANIYDSSKVNDKEYWRKVFKKSESCGYGTSNANSKTCGNCDYYLGSIGKKASGILGKPTYGNYICADLSCKSEGKKHGESWCVKDSPTGDGLDTVGSRYFKAVCLNNEVLVEPCADYRNEICIQGDFNGFTEAACRVNRWQDCMKQEESADCENPDLRDCMWVEGYYFSQSTQQIEKSNNDSKKGALTPTGLCVPNFPPGFNFWGSSSTTSSSISNSTPAFSAKTPAFGTGYVSPTTGTTSASSQCSLGNAKLSIKLTKEKSPLKFWDSSAQDGEWKCFNDECTRYVSDPSSGEITEQEAEAWAKDMNEICYRIGDCGGYINWQKKYTEEGYAAYKDGKRIAGSGGSEIQEKTKTTNSTPAFSGTTGNIVGNMIKNLMGVNN